MNRIFRFATVTILLFPVIVFAFSKSKVSEKSNEQTSADSVWVARSDGSKSCDANSANTLEDDQKKLSSAGIVVKSSKKESDDKMHIQMCGAETGKENAFKIPKSDLSKAEKLGFKQK